MDGWKKKEERRNTLFVCPMSPDVLSFAPPVVSHYSISLRK